MNWTNQSKNDLNRIKEFISADSIYQAERMIKEIYSSAQKLFKYPEIGRVIYSTKEYHVRRILVKSYRIIYIFHSDAISILAVQHQAKELDTDFDLSEI